MDLIRGGLLALVILGASLSAQTFPMGPLVSHVIVDSCSGCGGGPIGQTTMANSAAVVIASDQSAVHTIIDSMPAGGAGLTDTELRASAVPVSVASLPLPAGASTSALQTTGNTSVGSIDTKTPALGQALAAASSPVVLTAAQITTLTPPTTITANAGTGTFAVSGTFWQATQPVSGTFWQATQPISGTVTTAPPANASTNLAQIVGTAADVNSGVKSAGTLRVVLATDQPALTNKLLVTPDSVALPANQSVNINQIAGVTPVLNTGVRAAGVLRVTVATDDLVPVSLAANQSVNLAQVAGVATAAGAGIATTGTIRVVQAQELTYAAGTTVKTATAAGTGPFFSICGSATKTIRIQRFTVSGTVATAAVWGDVVLKRTSTATSGGTATALTKLPYDSTSAAGTATPNFYTVLATAGTSVGVVVTATQLFPVTAISATLQPTPIPLYWAWRDTDSEAVTLRGTAECLEANFGTTTTNAPTLTLGVVWTEK